MVDRYLSVSDIESFIGKEFSDTTSPTYDQIVIFINKAEDEFEREFGDMTEQTTEEVVDGYSFGFYVSKTPLNSISEIYYNSGSEFSPEWNNVLDSDEYYISNSDIGKVQLLNPNIGKKKYKIVYSSGYTVDAMPNIIKDIVTFITLKYVFKSNLFADQQFGEKETIIDVDVYREITKGGSPYTGLQDLDNVIDELKATYKNKFKTYLL